MLIKIISLLGAYIAMEWVAYAMHKYVMHGFLWSLHESHHKKGKGFFEKNDYYFLFFALLGSAFMVSGGQNDYNFLFFIGLGITLYGFTYLVIHDIIIHQRIKWVNKINHPYLIALRRAHRAHHASAEKEGGESFGMLWIDSKFFQAKG